MPREQYEVRWKDYYEILQVHPKAEAEVIAAAYRRLAQMYHPDSRRADPSASARMAEISEAKEVLSDPDRRARYDYAYSRVHAEQDKRHSYDSSREEGYRGYHDSGWNYDNDQGYDSGSSWYEEKEEWEPQPVSNYSYHPRPDNLLSFAFLRYLVNILVDRLAPNPDESQRILPWPSWRWQRVWLLAAPPLGGLSFLFALGNGAWAAVIFAAIFLAASIYAGMTTRWMREAQDAPWAARFAGGASITLSGISWSLGIAYGIFAIVMIVFFFLLSWAILRAYIEDKLR